MKKLISLISLVVIISLLIQFNGGLSLFNFSRTAYAVGDITVDWGVGSGDVGPVFSASNMAPGSSQTKTVKVTNGSPEVRPVSIRGVKNTETGNLAQVMTIVISKDGSDIYGGTTGQKTLADFFAATTLPNSLSLSNLNPSESEDYTMTITFLHTAGNEYQNKTLTFNLVVGIAADIPAACAGVQFSGNPIYGTSGNDKLRGTNKNDLIIALEGNDTVDGGNGNDCIIDSSGNGTLTGGNGDDIIIAGTGNTTLEGGNGDDVLRAGEGDDKLYGGNGDDVLAGEGGLDTLDGELGNDQLTGGEGNDKLVGGMGNDSLNGENGTDSADGEMGRDTCIAETKKACEL